MQVNGYAVTSVIFFSLGCYCSMHATCLYWRMVKKLNQALPPDKRVSYVFSYPGKMQLVAMRYAQIFPGDKVKAKYVVLVNLGLVFTGAGVIMLVLYALHH